MLPSVDKFKQITELIYNDVGEDEDCVNQIKRGTYSIFEDICSNIGVKHLSDLGACYMICMICSDTQQQATP